ncbi:hypothetical protein YK56LOC_33240 [Caballeronia sp. HLA56]
MRWWFLWRRVKPIDEFNYLVSIGKEAQASDYDVIQRNGLIDDEQGELASVADLPNRTRTESGWKRSHGSVARHVVHAATLDIA